MNATHLSGNEWGKDYRLNGFPALPNGKLADYSYEDYVCWLADYLVEATLAPKEEQIALLDRLTTLDSPVAMRVIGGHAGNDSSECRTRPHYRYPDEFDPESDFAPLVPMVPEEDAIWTEEPFGDALLQREFVREDYAYHLRYRREMEEFRDLWPQFQKQWNHTQESEGEIPEPPDAGWRVLLAAILKPVGEKAARIRLLYAFFEEYADAAD